MEVGIEDLNFFDVTRSIFTLISVVMVMIVGIKIMLNYRKHEKIIFLTIGLALIFFGSFYWSNAFSFISIIIFRYGFDPPLYIFFSNVFLPLGVICWVYSMYKLVLNKYNKDISIIVSVISIAYLIFVLIALGSGNYELVGSPHSSSAIFDYKRTLISQIFPIFIGVVYGITGLKFGIDSISSSESTLIWKGRFFIASIVCYFIVLTVDGIFTGQQYCVLRILTRMMLIVSSILYYFGFFLPEKVANILIKESDN